MLSPLRRDLHPTRPVSRRAWALAAVLATLAPLLTLGAQARTYTLLGDARSVQPTPGGVLLRAEHGSVLIESVPGVGVRVRVRFGDSVSTRFPTPHSLATGDAPPTLGRATVRDAGDTVVVTTAEGIEVRALRHPVRLVVRDAAGHELLHDSFGAGTFNGRLVHYVTDRPGTRYFALGEQPTGLARNGDVFPFWNTDRFGYQPGDMPIYSSMPFYIGVTDGIAHGVLYDNPFRGEMDFANRLPGSIGYSADGGIDGGELRYYVVPGPGLDSVLARFTRLTGRMPLPTALGARVPAEPVQLHAGLDGDERRERVPPTRHPGRRVVPRHPLHERLPGLHLEPGRVPATKASARLAQCDGV